MKELIMFTIFCLFIFFSAMNTAQSCGGQVTEPVATPDELTIYPVRRWF